MLFFMLFALVAKPSNSRSQMFFKTDVLKFYNILKKTPVSDPPFNKISGLKACIFIYKDTPI